MKKLPFLLLCLIIYHNSYTQDNIQKLIDPIVREGKALYKSEMASWYGTDIFLEVYKNHDNVGGYFSYMENEWAKCIFFSRSENPKVIGTITFDSTYNTSTAKTDLAERNFTPFETEMFTIRKAVLNILGTDSLFKAYKNSSLNLIPFIDENGNKKVYILTGPSENGVVIIGNDYLITFDRNNNITGKKGLHRNIIKINFGEKQENGQEVFGTMHTHLPETGDFITATDICTLMLYEKFAKWQQHLVISENYVCIWDCNKDQLVALTRKAWEKIYSKEKKNN